MTNSSKQFKRKMGENRMKHPLYSTYCNMKYRCYCKGHTSYPNYGARGIGVHESWLGIDGFTNYVKDVGEKPGKGYTLDRIDNNADYGPDNFKWVTWQEQNANRRNTGKKSGVCRYKDTGKWVATLIVDGKKVLFEHFWSEEEAIEARTKAEIKYLGRALA